MESEKTDKERLDDMIKSNEELLQLLKEERESNNILVERQTTLGRIVLFLVDNVLSATNGVAMEIPKQALEPQGREIEVKESPRSITLIPSPKKKPLIDKVGAYPNASSRSN